ncbi:MAG: hypothetical protein GY757_41770, partial [bacterium]|nr:hypothetical protein [bacterium]
YWGYTPPSPQMEILNGVTKTDAKGQFEVTFKAIPDLTISKANQPAFTFTVHADVTDINGETRSGRKSVSIGYTALKISMDIPGELDKAAGPHTFLLNSTTLSGDFIPAKGELSFYKLKEHQRICRPKRWHTPDKFVIDKKDYHKSFPHDEYDGEGNFRKWENEKRVYHSSFDTGETKTLKLTSINKWKTGKYQMEMVSRDKYGTPVKEIRYFTLYSTKGKKVPFKQLDWFTVPKREAEPGDKAIILLGTSAKDVRVIYEIEHRGKIVDKQYITLTNEQKKIEIPIKEKHRGNLGVHFVFIKHNRLIEHTADIIVPWTNKKLDITFETFRNKLKPGEKEEWRIKIRGKKGPNDKPGEKAAAEMVAALYDASLDAFKYHGWNFNHYTYWEMLNRVSWDDLRYLRGFYLYPYHSARYIWGADNYFTTGKAGRAGVFSRSSHFIHKHYERMNWFGFSWRPLRYSKKSIGDEDMYQVDGMDFTDSSTSPPYEVTASPSGDSQAKKKKHKKRNGGKEDAGDGDVDLSEVKARRNFQETAFFYPHLKTDKEGTIIIAFTVPEALTKWKMLGFAHTKDLKYGFTTNQLVTQKELMVEPNAPRFFREGDKLELTAKITNLAKETREGTAKLMLFDAATMRPVDAQFNNKDAVKTFKASKGQSDRVTWSLSIPDEIDAVTYRLVAASGKFSDGEEQAVPILKNRMLVTETLPLPVRAGKSKDYVFKKLVNSGKSTTIKHHKLTLEFTANPVW